MKERLLEHVILLVAMLGLLVVYAILVIHGGGEERYEALELLLGVVVGGIAGVSTTKRP